MIRSVALLCSILFASISLFAQQAKNTNIPDRTKDFTLKTGKTINVYLPQGLKPVANSAFEMLQGDIKTVLNGKATLVKSEKKADIACEISDTLQVEGFKIMVTNGRLHIQGADSHGLAYGLLEVSRLLGVSPWEYWADCTPRSKNTFTLEDGYVNEQYPHVRYRGIFINDEDWGMNPWATKQEPEAWTLKKGRIKGAVGPKVNEKIFQLLLRLRANYYWPSMHECSQPFFTIEGNREMAKKYGIYVGGSHCEPMATSPAVEWGVRGVDDYNYVSNRENVQKFWKDRLEQVKDQEIVYTIGMRGVHDGAMQGVKTSADKLKYLQQVIDDQRSMLQQEVHPDITKIPQVFVPYKEVLDVYKAGLKVPDDVTLMWTDDNYGYIRHFPDSVERARKGGNGLYYHTSYWGRPHDYIWLNSMPLEIMCYQLGYAYGKGIRQIWVLNVGDLKPGELQTEYFLEKAWRGNESIEKKVEINSSGESIPTYRTKQFTELFCEREFGPEYAERIKNILYKYFEQMSLCKPEFMAGTRTEEKDKAYWKQIHIMPGDWDKQSVAWRVNEFQQMSDSAEVIFRELPADKKDAFFELVKYPVQGAAQMSFKFLCPDICGLSYDSIQSLTNTYNKVCAGGKWDGIMNATPRDLSVFQKVSADMLPTYPDKSEWEPINHTDRRILDAESTYGFDVPEGTDSVTIQVRLMPTHPVDCDSLAFALSIDGGQWITRSYQTYDRNEEWKQNVLRGYAAPELTIAVDKNKTHHTLLFKRVTKGVESLRYMNRFFIKRERK